MDMKYIILLSCIILVLFPTKNSAGKLSELKPRIRREEIKLRIDELKPYIDELESHINKLKPRIRRETTNDNLHRSLIESIDDWLMKKMISVTF